MTPEVFVSQVRAVIVQQNFTLYKDLFETIRSDAASDDYWKRALALHRSLSETDRSVLFEIMRQVAVDTVSNLLGILDGTCAVDGLREGFVLTSQPDNQTLNGNLQDLFLEADQLERRQSLKHQ